MGIDPRPSHAVFLDRDGVLNRCFVDKGKPRPARSAQELEILPRVPEALARLAGADFLLIAVTNQPDVGRGTLACEAVEEIHAQLLRTLPLDEILVCYSAAEEDTRRKPNPGMLVEAAKKYEIDLSRSFIVGDRWKDIEAGRRAGCRTIFLDHGYAEPFLASKPDFTTYSLWEASHWILANRIESPPIAIVGLIPWDASE